MSDLGETQRALAKILTDSKARREYFHYRQSHSSVEHEHSAHPALDSLKSHDLERSAETLLRKRRSQIRSMLPRTTKILGSDYPIKFQFFAVSRHFDGLHAIAREAIAFSDWLHQQPDVPQWIAELSRYESLTIRWSRSIFLIQFFRFHYDIATWLAQNTTPPNPPQKRWKIVVLWRIGRYGNINRL
jgi:hypothetical protein